MLNKKQLDEIRKRMKYCPEDYKIVGNRAYTINDFTGEWTEITEIESSKPVEIKDAIRKGIIKTKRFSDTNEEEDKIIGEAEKESTEKN